MATPNTANTTSTKPQGRWDAIKHILDRILCIVVPLGCSVWMLLWLFHKVDFHRMMEIIASGVDYWWILLMMLITILSHMVRGTRWGIQLGAVGVRPPLLTLWVSIFGAYALNLLFTGVGETWRCVYISRRQRVPLATVVGTDIGDRLSDLAVILLLCLLMVIVADRYVVSFLDRYMIGRGVLATVSDIWFWIGLISLSLAIWAVFKYFGDRGPMPAISRCCRRIWNGFKVIFTMPGRGEYLMLTFGIWICYFMETYVCFNAFPFTGHFITTHSLAYGFLPGLVCFVFCSVSMGIPSNGGLGPWNVAMVFGLSLFGIDATEGAAFAMLMWSAQALTLIALGIFSAIYVSVTRYPSAKGTKLAAPVDNGR